MCGRYHKYAIHPQFSCKSKLQVFCHLLTIWPAMAIYSKLSKYFQLFNATSSAPSEKSKESNASTTNGKLIMSHLLHLEIDLSNVNKQKWVTLSKFNLYNILLTLAGKYNSSPFPISTWSPGSKFLKCIQSFFCQNVLFKNKIPITTINNSFCLITLILNVLAQISFCIHQFTCQQQWT